MSYIDKNLLPDERILFRTKKHLIIFFVPVLIFIFSFVAYQYMISNPMLYKLAGVPWLVTLMLWCYTGLEYFASDYAVTDKRVLMREGFFYRHTNELRLSTISQIHVDQSLLGQMLNYGTVSINAFGAFDNFMYIAKPNTFQRLVNQQLDKLVR